MVAFEPWLLSRVRLLTAQSTHTKRLPCVLRNAYSILLRISFLVVAVSAVILIWSPRNYCCTRAFLCVFNSMRGLFFVDSGCFTSVLTHSHSHHVFSWRAMQHTVPPVTAHLVIIVSFVINYCAYACYGMSASHLFQSDVHFYS